MNLEKLFDSVRGLPGVLGLGLLDAEGQLRWHQSPPALVDASDLGEALAATYRLLDEARLQADDLVLEFGDRWLMLRRNGPLVAVMLATGESNTTSIRMMSGLLVKHLTLEAVAALMPPAVDVARLPAVDTRDPAVSATRPQRMYRGQPY